jgi:hypothetical protein
VVVGTVVVVGTIVVVVGTRVELVLVVELEVVLDELVVELLLVLDELVEDDDEVVVVGAHSVLVTVLESNLTEALRAISRPATVVPVPAVTEVKARMEPTNVEPTPRTAELPTCQKTLHGFAPLVNSTWLLTAVMSVEPAWKMNTAAGSPWPLRLSVPVMKNDEGDL